MYSWIFTWNEAVNTSARVPREIKRVVTLLDYASPLIDVVIRLWLAEVFFRSGLVKMTSWQSTLALFENEYHVPLLPPIAAAYLGTFVELVFPVLLALGLGARFSCIVLFVFNAVAVLSYPDLSEAGLKDHYYWGLLLLVPLLHGPGKLSVDLLIARRWGGHES